MFLYHSFFIYSSVDGQLGCFRVLAIINSAAMNTGVHVSFSPAFIFLLLLFFFLHSTCHHLEQNVKNPHFYCAPQRQLLTVAQYPSFLFLFFTYLISAYLPNNLTIFPCTVVWLSRKTKLTFLSFHCQQCILVIIPMKA